jgi:mannose-6-phosphate isomerase-like protein (cupin superfamily)
MKDFRRPELARRDSEGEMPILVPGPAYVQAAGNKPKVIEEFVGRIGTGTGDVSIARMRRSPGGWAEPGQTPEFDEYRVVLRGTLRVVSKEGTLEAKAGQAIVARRGEWVQYSTPGPDGADYLSVCIPAFSPATVHRDE